MKHRNLWRIGLSMSLTLLIAVAGFAADAPPKDALPMDIPLANAGFEDSLANWSVGSKFTNQVDIVNATVHTGRKAVMIDATQKTNMPFIGNVVTGLMGGATYQFSAWARVAPGSPAVQAGVKMENYNAAGVNTSGQYGMVSLPADGTWMKISVTEQVDPDSIKSSLLLRVFGKGAVVFDDTAFALTKEAPEVTLTSNQQMVINPNRTRRITYFLALRQPWTDKKDPEITAALRPLGTQMDSSETTLLRAYVNRTDNKNFTANITIPALAEGDYVIDFGYHRDGKFLQTADPAYLFTAVQNRKPKNLTDDGTILFHGKPFFPIGMYHPGDYKLLSENGFNAIQGNGSFDMGEFKDGLDRAQKYGLAVDVPLYGGGQVRKNLANSLEKIQKFADHPAILCWKIKDEPDITENKDLAAEVPGAYRTLKAADPNHPLELTMASDAGLGFWKNFCDIVQIDRYPVQSATDPADLSPVASFSRNAKSVMEPWQNLTFDVQSGWTLDLSTQPTVAQARSMVYLAITSGAKGIFWYSMTESTGWDLTKTPLWSHMKDINGEIKTISEPILSGQNVPVQTSNLKVHVMAKKYQNKLYVFFTNPLPNDVSATFKIYGLNKLIDGKYVKTAFSDDEKVTVGHSTSAPNSIDMKLKALQSGTMVFDIGGK